MSLRPGRYERVPGLRITSLDDETWAAYSPVSGETHLLNETAAAIVELLGECGLMSADEVCAALARDSGLSAGAVATTLGDVWSTLQRSGLVRAIAAAA